MTGFSAAKAVERDRALVEARSALISAGCELEAEHERRTISGDPEYIDPVRRAADKCAAALRSINTAMEA